MKRKPTAAYRMSKQTKFLLANIVDPVVRATQKQAWIQAELAYQDSKHRKIKVED